MIDDDYLFRFFFFFFFTVIIMLIGIHFVLFRIRKYASGVCLMEKSVT